ncbi:hypothetical protein LQ564_00075 [Massilia sp. G4R7]|uniref:Uncharacterized protein n=1 Tax=Massilia phyllostachyos TaxID=2898585 RepID=A0ABS8PYW2_9BURK|nr:hypothetical protein [Massilia phyllostachyos]MCD2514705.1 hypothetical protein [Massilia phyllostachyos]
MINHEVAQVDRETLYEEVWSEPVTLVAFRYGLSDVGLAKICRSLAIPLPSRGYWSKVKAGRVMKRVPLPSLTGAQLKTRKMLKLSDEQLKFQSEVRDELVKLRKESADQGLICGPFQLHPLVQAASTKLHRKSGWPTDTNLRSAPKEILNISSTFQCLDRALGITNTLLSALTVHGFLAFIEPENAVTKLRQESTGIELTFSLTEQVKRSVHVATEAEEAAQKRYFDRFRRGISTEYPSIPQYDYHATGVLVVTIGSWPSRTWRDTPKTLLEERLSEVVAGILALAKETYAKKMDDLQKEQDRQIAKENYERSIKRRQLEASRFQEMETQALNWERAERIREFLKAFEQRKVAESSLTQDDEEWLSWAHAKANWLDPLISVSDLILDAPEPKKPGYY